MSPMKTLLAVAALALPFTAFQAGMIQGGAQAQTPKSEAAPAKSKAKAEAGKKGEASKKAKAVKKSKAAKKATAAKEATASKKGKKSCGENMFLKAGKCVDAREKAGKQ